MESIKFDLYFEYLQDVVRGSLKEKGLVGAEENAALMKHSLAWGFTEDRTKRLIQAEKSSWFANTLVGIIESHPHDPGRAIYRLRMSAQSLGIDLGEDVPELTVGNREFLFRNELRYHLSEASVEADSETVGDMVEQYALREALYNNIMEAEFSLATRQSAVDLLGNMARGDTAGALRDLLSLLRVANILPLPLVFKEEPYLGVKVMAEVVRVWTGIAAAVGKREANLPDIPDMAKPLKLQPDDVVKDLTKNFDEKESLVMTLISNLATVEDQKAQKIDKYVNFMGKRVERKFVDREEKGKTNKDWAKFETKSKDGLRPMSMNEPGAEKRELKKARIVSKVREEKEIAGKLAAPWPMDDRALPVVPRDGTFEIPPSDRAALIQWMKARSAAKSLKQRALMNELAEIEERGRNRGRG